MVNGARQTGKSTLVQHLFPASSAPHYVTLDNLVTLDSAVMELMKQIGWSETQPNIYHFRTEAGQEVDIVLETGDGRIVGIECKSAIRLSPDSFKGLRVLKEITGKKFHRGIVLYVGSETLAFEKHFEAIPFSALWETNSGKAPALFS